MTPASTASPTRRDLISRCVSAPNRDPARNGRQHTETDRKLASMEGSRSAPMGTPALFMISTLDQRNSPQVARGPGSVLKHRLNAVLT